MLAPLPGFPKHTPKEYKYMDDETRYDPDKHLSLEFPERI